MTAAGRIAVLGEALVDRFPDRDVLGGAPFNVARNLAAWGLSPLLVSRIGDDPAGAQVREECRRFGVDTRGLQADPRLPTGAVKVHMHGTHHEFEVLREQAWDHLDAAAAVRAVEAARPALVYFGTLGQRSPASRHAIRSALQATPALRFLDLNLRAGNDDNRQLSADSLGLADLVKVNDDELAQLLDWFIDPRPAGWAWGGAGHPEAVAALMRRFALRRLVVTRGPDGWAAFDADGRMAEGASAPVRVKDTVGAGDAFSSVALLGELSGWPLEVALERAAAFASSVCGIQGAVDPTLALYGEASRRWGATPSRSG